MEIEQTERGFALDCALDLPRPLHARPAAKIAQKAREYDADILLLTDTGEADAKSMLDILSLAIQPDAKIRLLANGTDAKRAILELARIINGDLA